MSRELVTSRPWPASERSRLRCVHLLVNTRVAGGGCGLGGQSPRTRQWVWREPDASSTGRCLPAFMLAAARASQQHLYRGLLSPPSSHALRATKFPSLSSRAAGAPQSDQRFSGLLLCLRPSWSTAPASLRGRAARRSDGGRREAVAADKQGIRPRAWRTAAFRCRRRSASTSSRHSEYRPVLQQRGRTNPAGACDWAIASAILRLQRPAGPLLAAVLSSPVTPGQSGIREIEKRSSQVQEV